MLSLFKLWDSAFAGQVAFFLRKEKLRENATTIFGFMSHCLQAGNSQ
jgi:hypothetical protein